MTVEFHSHYDFSEHVKNVITESLTLKYEHRGISYFGSTHRVVLLLDGEEISSVELD